ncbi:hypothetical protein AX17_004275 [Amanita inopinata Kibby_2008]|nr:hypothetical protein AX17_004275 [Amanita inopinata Kibby_2008]
MQDSVRTQDTQRVDPSRSILIPEVQSYGEPLNSFNAQEELDDLELWSAPPISVMQHDNRSVSSIPPLERSSHHSRFETVDSVYDSSTLSSFTNLHISETDTHTIEPVHRTPSSMSIKPVYQAQVAIQSTHSNNTPPLNYIQSSCRAVSGPHGPQPQGGFFVPHGGYVDDQAPIPPSEDQSAHYAHIQRPWLGTQQTEYNPLYVAASSVLGMGPPPDPHVATVAPGLNHYRTQVTSAASLSSMQPHVHLAEAEIEPRPTLHRAGTSVSVSLNTQKSKAVDLASPPYTKEYIDQYRQRIKTDPDPEAHFLYARYLIDAARNIRATAKDQRAGKKYCELLIAESLKVIRRLATQGNPYDEAQFFLANCYGTGALGLQVDHERAYHLYLQAAKQNHAAATYRVAVCNEIGAGTRREPPRAAAFYRKAASLGDTAAMYKLGMILLHGSLGEQKNAREATSWLKRAAEQADAENPHALHELGLLYEQPDSQLVPYDPSYAKSLFTHAAQLGYTASQYKLGQCYEYGILTCHVDPRRSIAWYTKAAEKGDAEAELALSGWYLTGSEGVLKQSDSEAYLWARRAANKGLSKAEYAVGYYAEVGIGIKQDIEFAKRWYMRAAAQGNKRAMNRLTEMKRMGNKRSNVGRPTRQQAKDECTIC